MGNDLVTVKKSKYKQLANKSNITDIDIRKLENDTDKIKYELTIHTDVDKCVYKLTEYGLYFCWNTVLRIGNTDMISKVKPHIERLVDTDKDGVYYSNNGFYYIKNRHICHIYVYSHKHICSLGYSYGIYSKHLYSDSDVVMLMATGDLEVNNENEVFELYYDCVERLGEILVNESCKRVKMECDDNDVHNMCMLYLTRKQAIKNKIKKNLQE